MANFKVIYNDENDYAKLIDKKNITDIVIKYSKNSMLDLQYMCMLKLLNNNIKNICIEPESSTIVLNKEWANISDYLYLIKKDRHFFNLDNQLETKGFVNQRGLKYNYYAGKIIPLIFIDKEHYLFLKKPIKEVYSNICKKRNNDNYFDFQAYSDKHNSFEDEIKSYCVDCLFDLQSSILNDMILIEHKKYYSSSYFYEIASEMTMLSFLLFCVHYYYILNDNLKNYVHKNPQGRNSNNIFKELQVSNTVVSNSSTYRSLEMENLINCSDIADGILQLLENIVYHAGDTGDNGQGFLSLRIHEYKNSKEYLKQNFSRYFEGIDARNYINGKSEMEIINEYQNISDFYENADISLKEYCGIKDQQERRKIKREKYKYYIEIRIADISNKNLVEEYLKEISTIRNAPDISKKLKDLNFSLKDIFDNSNKKIYRIMDNFNKRYENAIHHYGLELFDSLILSNDGYFSAKCGSEKEFSSRNFYSTCGNDEIKKDYKMPGTQYQILIPFQHKIAENQFGCPNINIMYKAVEKMNVYFLNGLTSNSQLEKSLQKKVGSYYLILKENSNFNKLEEKEKKISNLASILMDIIEGNSIYVFNAKEIHNVELFVKSIIFFITRKLNDDFYYIAIRNCSPIDIIEIIRVLAIFYNKEGISKITANIEFFLYNDTQEEFWVSGKNIKDVLNIVTKSGLTRGYRTFISDIFESLLRKKPYANYITENSLNILPFDILIKEKSNQISLFEKHTKNILNKSMLSNETGFRLEHTHIRIGSKIHLDSFYEAELLFHNSYYTSRFTKIIKQRLYDNYEKDGKIFTDFDEEKDTIIIGYEIYSEMLIYELSKIIGKHVTYTIFINSHNPYLGKIRNIENILEKISKNFQVIYIVPISTTLTTFEKIEKQFLKYVNNEFKFKSYYISVIEVRDNRKEITEQEKEYWKSISFSDRYIEYSLEDNKLFCRNIRYLIEVNVNWKDALKCELCYPNKSINEIPLIETNRSSVVPMQLIGIKPKESMTFENLNINLNDDNKERIVSLKNYLYYGHLLRGNKHYRYYIDTENYFLDKQEKISEWLENNILKQEISTNMNILTYNIIISPLHASNSSFVKKVHDILFNETALVVHIDTDKEYRGNFYTKYNYIKEIYDNLCKADMKAIINVYYVDDEIIHGNSILRAKSLIKTLFYNENYNSKNVKLHLFKGIIVLIDRLSKYTKNNYIEDIGNFYAYINLRISHLRTHEDSCYLCSREKFYENASQNTVFIDLKQYFSKCKKHYELKSVETAKNKKENLFKIESMLNNCINFDGFKLLFAVHYITETLDKMKFQKNNKVSVFSFLINLLLSSGLNTIYQSEAEKMIYIVTAMSSPFLVYRKSCLETIFDLVLIMLEIIVNKKINIASYLENSIDKKRTEKTYLLTDYNKSRISCLSDKISNLNTQENITLLMILMRQSMYMNCNYIIRIENIEKIITYMTSINYFSHDMKVFYLSLIYQLINTHSDESKANFLEYSIINDYTQSSVKKDIITLENFNEFYTFVLFDNTKIYLSALRNIKFNKLSSKINKNIYFMKNFVKNMNYWYFSDNKIIQDMSSIFNYLDNNEVINTNRETIKFYSELSQLLNNLFDEKIECYFCCEYEDQQLECEEIEHSDNFQKYKVTLKKVKKYGLLSEQKEEKKLDWIEEVYSKLLLSTYYIDKDTGLIKFSASNNENDNSIYLVLLKNKSTLNIDLRDYMSSIKLLFLFYSRINAHILKHFSNNLIQEISRMKFLQRQFGKARTLDHNRDSYTDGMNPLNIADLYLFGKPGIKRYFTTNSILKNLYGYNYKNIVFGLYNNRIIGKINMRLLSGKSMNLSDHWKYLSYRVASSLKYSIYFELIRIFDINDDLVEQKKYNQFFKKLFPTKDNIYIKKNGKLLNIKDFCAILVEIIQSAAKHGKRENENYVKVKIWKDYEYLCISNEVKDNFKFESIMNGFRRYSDGISLAVLGEVIDKFYHFNNNKLIVEYKNQSIIFKLPIYKIEEKKNEQINLFR